MNIAITGRDAKPRVINVKQYSSGIDEVTFTISGKLPTGKVKGYMVSDKYRQDIDFTASDTGGTVQWYIADVFTRSSGTLDLQLELTNGTEVWRSDVIMLIVSESTAGDEAVSSSSSSEYPIIYTKIILYEDNFTSNSLSDRIFTDGTIFTYKGE